MDLFPVGGGGGGGKWDPIVVEVSSCFSADDSIMFELANPATALLFPGLPWLSGRVSIQSSVLDIWMGRLCRSVTAAGGTMGVG